MSYCAKHDAYHDGLLCPLCTAGALPTSNELQEEMRARLAALTAEQLDALTAENERLRESLAKKAEAHLRAEDACDRLTEDAAKRCADLRADNARLVESLTAEGARYEQWRREAERLKAEIECVKSNDSTWFARMDRLTDDLASMTKQRDGWADNCRIERERGDRLRAKLAAKLAALRAAAKAWADYWDAPATEASDWGVLRDALRAAVAASEEP